MRLFNINSREVQPVEFPPSQPYAIFSHQYLDPGDNEWYACDSGDMQELSRRTIIDKACLLALQNGLSFIWIDSLCVNKQSSAEVSETINCLWRYFQSAAFCLVYLFDLPCEPFQSCEKTWKQSLFWSRSWSLQEMLFSQKIYFYDSKWHLRGDTSLGTFSSLLSRVTGIDEDVLTKRRSIHTTSIARRMSWAVGKVDSRVEDSSYALLGIFGVCMPIIYGEGKHSAFRRLQEEVLKKTSDMTLFAWTSLDDAFPRGMFAHSVEEFNWFGRTQLASVPFHLDGFAALTSGGVLIQSKCLERNKSVFLDLGMQRQKLSQTKRCGILIRKGEFGTYHRVSSSMTQMAFVDEPTKVMQVLVEAGDINGAAVRDDGKSNSLKSTLATRQRMLRSSIRPSMGNLSNTSLEASCSSQIETSTSCNHPKLQATATCSPGEGIDLDWVHVGSNSRSPGCQQDQDQEADQTSKGSDCDSLQSCPEVDLAAQTSPPRSIISEETDYASDGGESSPNEGTMQTPTKRSSPSPTTPTDDVTIIRRLARQSVQQFQQAQHILTREMARQKRRGKTKRAISGSPRHKTHGLRRGSLSQTTEFACPYFVESPWDHLGCLRSGALYSMSDVRDHLWRSHRVPLHCPVCIQPFVSTVARDEHVVKRECNLQDYPTFQGVTEDQDDLITQTQKIPGRKKQWFAVWNILFRASESLSPKSPFLNDTVGSEICQFRTFCKIRGPALVESFAEEVGRSAGLSEVVERDAAKLREMVIFDAINMLVDGVSKGAPDRV